jgi:hypothetical protein
MTFRLQKYAVCMTCGHQDLASAMHAGVSGTASGQVLCDKGPAGHITSPELLKLLEDLLAGHLVRLRSQYVLIFSHASKSS